MNNPRAVRKAARAAKYVLYPFNIVLPHNLPVLYNCCILIGAFFVIGANAFSATVLLEGMAVDFLTIGIDADATTAEGIPIDAALDNAPNIGNNTGASGNAANAAMPVLILVVFVSNGRPVKNSTGVVCTGAGVGVVTGIGTCLGIGLGNVRNGNGEGAGGVSIGVTIGLGNDKNGNGEGVGVGSITGGVTGTGSGVLGTVPLLSFFFGVISGTMRGKFFNRNSNNKSNNNNQSSSFFLVILNTSLTPDRYPISPGY